MILGGREVERVTYRTITRSEFQKRRASFEGGGEWPEKGMGMRTRSVDELKRKEDGGGIEQERMLHQEKEMTDKLEDIHRMIVDMQQLTRQLKESTCCGKDSKILGKSIGSISPKTTSEYQEIRVKPIYKSVAVLTLKPVRYRSTILITIGSKWRRFKEEIELKAANPQFISLN